MIELFNDLVPAIMAAQDTDLLAIEMKTKISNPGLSKAGGHDESTNTNLDMHWIVIMGAITYRGRISVPEALQNPVICLFHDSTESGYFASLQTAALVSRDLYWLGLDTTVRKYVASFKVCH